MKSELQVNNAIKVGCARSSLNHLINLYGFTLPVSVLVCTLVRVLHNNNNNNNNNN